jgi:hypothetical protein
LSKALCLLLFSYIESNKMRDFSTDTFLLLYRLQNHVSVPHIIRQRQLTCNRNAQKNHTGNHIGSSVARHTHKKKVTALQCPNSTFLSIFTPFGFGQEPNTIYHPRDLSGRRFILKNILNKALSLPRNLSNITTRPTIRLSHTRKL